MKFKKYLVLILLIPLFAFGLHKYYISLCEIEFIEEKKAVHIILGVFIDDLEVTLNKDYDANLYLATERDIENIDEIYEAYLNKNFFVILNEKPVSYIYIGKKYDDDIVRFYLEISNVETLSSIEIQNTSLLRDFQDQQNIIKINVGKLHKTFYLDKENANCLLKI